MISFDKEELPASFRELTYLHLSKRLTRSVIHNLVRKEPRRELKFADENYDSGVNNCHTKQAVYL